MDLAVVLQEKEIRNMGIAHEGSHGMPHREHHLARRNAAEPALRELLRAQAAEQRHADGSRRDHRLGQPCASRLFEEKDEIDLVHPQSVVLLWDQQARHTHLGEAGPELGGATGLCLPEGPDLLGRALGLEEIVNGVSQEQLVLGEVKAHG
jgi:hypothetical protein